MSNINSTSRHLYSPLYYPFDEQSSGGGGPWDKPTSRRRFLKRTGGATAATLIAWHATGMRSHADGASEDPPVEIVITIADGASMQGTKEHLNGEPANLSGATVTKRDKLNSGESFTPWNFRIDGARTEASMVNGKVVVMLYGPGTITYSRSKVKQ